MNQDLPQIDVSAFADPEQLCLASGRVLAWYDPQPRSEVPALTESGAVADGGNDGGGYDGSNSWNLPDPRASCICGRDAKRRTTLHSCSSLLY